MSQDSSRRADRVELSTRARVRGVCGDFDATALDISLTGIRLRISRTQLKLAEDADLATAAATVQTRIGSRCALELGLRQLSRPLTKRADLVRLVLPGSQADSLELGCRFDEPLVPAECKALRVTLPEPTADVPVRRKLAWEEEPRPRLDPSVAQEKVESLFGVETEVVTKGDERTPRRPLRGILTSVQGVASAPLVCTIESLTVSTVLVRVRGARVDTWLSGRRDLSEVAQAVKADFGSWPELEIADGSRRLWRGGARVCGLEVGEASDEDVLLRLAFGRRLVDQELDRICDAA